MAPTTLPPITSELADFIAGLTPAEIPDEVWETSRFAVTDWFAKVVAGRAERLATPLSSSLDVLAPDGPSTELARGRHVAPQVAAMVNATLAHSLDFDDVHLASGAHATAPGLAAALAVGQERGISTSLDLATAFVIGYEVMVRIGAPLHETLFRTASHPTGTFGYFGAAATTARLLGLNNPQSCYALGLAGSQAGSCTQVRGTMNKPFLAGHAAQGGVASGYLSASGYESAEDIIEGPSGFYFSFDHLEDAAEVTRELGSRWEILQNSIKVHASCAMSHALIDAVLEARSPRAAGLDVEAIDVHMYPLGTEYLNRPAVSTGAAGKFSAQYCAVVAWLAGVADPTQFTDARVQDPAVQALMAKVRLIPLDGAPVDVATVHVRLADGSSCDATVTGFTGSPEKPLTWDQLCDKSHRLMSNVLAEPTRRKLIETLAGWPDVDLAQLMALARPA